MSDVQKTMKESSTPDATYDATQLLQQLAFNQQNAQAQQQDDEIDLAELWRAIWAGKWVIIAVTTVFAIASVAYALYLPNIYKSEALLAPAAQESGGMGGLASKFGGLASLAGINLGGGGGIDKTALALEIMKSRVFVTKFIEQHQLLVPLMATKGWDRNSNKLIYDADIYDTVNKEWVREVKKPFEVEPSAQEAYAVFKKNISISQDKSNTMVTISVKHYSPEIAKKWVDLLIDAINFEMKTRDLTEARKSIAYLEHQLGKTKLNELQNVLYQIIEEQTKTIMFAEVREQYVFKTIDPAVVPEVKTDPKRALICLLGMLLGAFLGIIVVFVNYIRISSKNSSLSN